MAYDLAEQYRAAKTEADQKAAPGKKRIAGEVAGKKRSVAPDGTEYKKVRFEGEIKKWSEKQKAEVEFIDFIAANFSGNTVRVYESYKNAKGQYVYKDSNGKIQAAPNGVYIDSTGDIYLDLNAGNHGEGLVMNTFAHELYHHIERESPQKARKLEEFLVQELGYENVEIAVQRQIDKAQRAGHGVEYLMKENGISRTAAERLLYDRAFSDFVADSLETMFTEGNVVETLKKLKSQDAGLFNMIKSFIDKWVKRIRQFYRSHSTISIEGDMVSHLKKFEQIQQMFAEALVDAGENFSNTEHISEDVSSKVKFSVREIIGHSGKNYGIGVYLDSTLLDGLSEDERVDMVKEYVKELGGSVFTAYDNDGGAVDVHIVEWGKKFKNKSGNKVEVNKDLTHYLKNEIQQEAIALVDELIISSTYRGTEPATHKHDWVDNDGKNDWDVWTTYIQDKENTVWEAKLRIANSANGEKILYDIFPIKMVEGARTLAATTTNDMVSQPAPTVKNESSEAMDIAMDADTESVAPALAEYKESHKGAKFSDRDSDSNHKASKGSPYNGRSLYKDGDVYNYDFMITLPNMKVHTMPSLSSVKTGNRVDQGKAVRLGLENASSVGREVSDGLYAIKNLYTEREILLGQNGLEHGLDGGDVGRLRTNARLSAIGGLIVQNSVPVNGLKNKNRQAKGTYAMACLLKSGDRDVVAIVTVEEHTSKAVGIDYVDITHSINGRLRKNSEGSLSSTRETGYDLTAAPSAATFDISIAEFLEIVNETHRSILSQDVLDHFNEERPSDGHYADRVLFSDRDTESVSNRSLLANAFEGAAQTDMEKQKIREYRGKIDLMNGQEQKLRKLNQQIKELSFAKGKRDTAKIRALRDEATKTANRISIYDKQLLCLESSKPLQYGFKRAKRCWQETKTPPGARKTRLGGVVI